MRLRFLCLAALMACLIFFSTVGGQSPAARPAEVRRVSFTMSFHITGQQGTEKVVFTALVPKSIEGRQKILKIKYSHRPEREFEEKGNKYARFVLLKPAGLHTVAIDVEAELYRYDLSVASGQQQGGPESQDRLKPWLGQEKFIEKDAPEIQQAAKSITGTDELDTLQNIMAFVHRKLRYSGFDAVDRGALWALKNGKGDCTEYSDLFVALCRTKNIPARVWEGYLTHDIPRGDTAKHVRVEAYTQKYGWVPFDPLHAARGHAKFESLKPVYVYLGCQRNDPLLQNYHYVAYRYFGKPVKLESDFAVAGQAAAERETRTQGDKEPRR